MQQPYKFNRASIEASQIAAQYPADFPPLLEPKNISIGCSQFEAMAQAISRASSADLLATAEWSPSM
jgi:hypothetical protein